MCKLYYINLERSRRHKINILKKNKVKNPKKKGYPIIMGRQIYHWLRGDRVKVTLGEKMVGNKRI